MTTTHISEGSLHCLCRGRQCRHHRWCGDLARLFGVANICSHDPMAGFLPGLSDMLCINSRGGLPLNGMMAMYALMSLFHLAPWLSLLRCSIQRGGAAPRAPSNCSFDAVNREE